MTDKRYFITQEHVGLEVYTNAYVHQLEVQIERLRAALEPFAKLAAGIPDNWPGQCPLRIDSGLYRGGPKHYEYVAYHGIGDDAKPLGYHHVALPTIAEWRAVEEVMK